MKQKQLSLKQKIFLNFKKIFKRAGLCVFLLLLLIYILFPYTLVKNYFLSSVRGVLAQNNIYLNIDMKSLKPYWLTGIEFNNLEIQNTFDQTTHSILVSNAHIRFSILPLFIGRLNFNATVHLQEGKTVIFGSFPLSVAWTKNIQNFKFKSTFENFEIESFMDQYLAVLQTSNAQSMSLLSTLIDKISIGGLLNGIFNFELHSKRYDGSLDLNMDDFYFAIRDPALNIPIQNFKQARTHLVWNQDTYNIKDDTIFESENLFIKPRGSIQMMNNAIPIPPTLNLDLLLILSGEIEKNFGFFVPQLLKCPSSTMLDGVMNVKLSGSILQPVCQ